MATIEITGKIIEVDKEGYLQNTADWNEAVAEYLAQENGIEALTENHWEILNFVKEDFQMRGEVPTLRRMRKTGGFPVNLIYELFPDGPAKKIAKIAGYPKPQGCV